MLYVYIPIIVICAICSALASASDFVYGAVDQDKLQKDAENGNKKAAKALKIARDYELSISTVLFVNSIVNIVASSFVTLCALLWVNKSGKDFGQSTILTAIFTLLLIIFCEFLPKAIAKRYTYKLALFFVPFVNVVKYSPTFIVVWPLSKLLQLFGRLFKEKSKEEDIIDDDVLDEMVDTIEEQGGLDEDEAELVRGAIDLYDIQAYEIMTPRVDVFAIDINDDIEELIQEPDFFTHSRIPVFEDTIDNILGVVSAKSIIKAKLDNEKIDIKSLLYKPLFVPRNHQVLDLLEEFKKERSHIAIVMDEYGGFEGVVTMEDILEEIVGDIFDEQDKVEEEYTEIKEGKEWILSGGMNIDDAFELIGIDEEEIETDYTTIGGYCQEVLDRFAKTGDKFDVKEYTFEVLDADKYTVEKLRVINNKEVEEE